MEINDIYWLAGLIEGEGWIGKRDNHNTIGFYVGVKMTDEDIILRIKEVTRLGNIYGPYKEPYRKPTWTWTMGKEREIMGLIITIYPIMGKRRQEQIRDVLDAWKKKRSNGSKYCKFGHLKDKIGSNGYLRCRTCDNINNSRRNFEKSVYLR